MTSSEFRATLKALGLSQRDLASRLGVVQSTAHRWAAGDLDVPQYVVAYLEAVTENQRLHQAIEACRAACQAHTIDAVRQWQPRFLGDWRKVR